MDQLENSLVKTGFKMTDALKQALKDNECDICVDEEPPLTEEPPLSKQEGQGRISFLCDKKTSAEITNNNIDGDDRIVWDRRFFDQIKEARDKCNMWELILVSSDSIVGKYITADKTLVQLDDFINRNI